MNEWYNIDFSEEDSYGDEDSECEPIWDGPYNCTEDARQQVDFVAFCEYSEIYDCWGDYEGCQVKISVDGEYYEGDCDEIADMLGFESDYDDDEDYSDWEDDECMVYMEESCMEMPEIIEQGGISECWYEMHYDVCADEEVYCWVWFTHEGEDYEGMCHEDFFGEHSDSDDHHYSDDDDMDSESETDGYDYTDDDYSDDWCEEKEHGPFKCPEQYGLDHCEYWLWEGCDDNDECWVVFEEDGEMHEGHCEEFHGEDDCEVTCSETFECPDHEMEWCQMTECHDSCTDHTECYAEWTKDEQYDAAECGDYWEMHECKDEEEKPNQCDYFECDGKDGGECWIEKCNIDVKCKKETCTHWEYMMEGNYWVAVDCAKKDDDKDMDFFHNVFDHAGKVLTHYDDTLSAYAKWYVWAQLDNIEHDTINEFLADDKKTYVA